MLSAIVLISAEVDRIPEVAAAIAELKGVSEVYSVTGDVDLIAVVRVRHHDELADVIADQPYVEALIDRAFELDPDWDHGAIHSFLINYESSRPGGAAGAEDRARKHFDRQVVLIAHAGRRVEHLVGA